MKKWSDIRTSTHLRNGLLLSIGLLIATLTGFFFVLEYIETRDGIVIEKGWLDPICKPVNLSYFIFPLTWPVAFIGVIICSRNPELLVRLLIAYSLFMLLRAITLLSVPLDPPEHTIHLIDPVLEHTFYNGRPNLKDLFFSGHVGTIILFWFILKNSKWKYFFLACAIVLAVMITIQRVHYVIDVLAAPFFAWLSCVLTEKFLKKIG